MADAAAVPAHVAALVQQREQARAAGDDATVVWLTTQLRNMGYEIREGPSGAFAAPLPGGGRGAGRGRGRGAPASPAAAPGPGSTGRGRGSAPAAAAGPQPRATPAPKTTPAAAAPPKPAVVSSAVVDVPASANAFLSSDDDDYGGEEDDDEAVRQLAMAMENEWSTYEGVDAPAAADLGVGADDNPGLFRGMATAEAEADENYDRPPDHQWHGAAPHWTAPDPGAIGPRDPELEKKIFATGQQSVGINFEKYNNVPVTVSGDRPVPAVESFAALALGEPLASNIVLAGFKTPTPVQKQAIPIALARRDLMACAQTGSGKTAAFLLPLLRHVLSDGPLPKKTGGSKREPEYPRILILAPTRELACQIFDDARKFAYRSWVRPCVVYGGAEMSYQVSELRSGCELLVATPGRLADMMGRGIVSLQHVKYLVLDEADRMLDMGFEPQIRHIVQEADMPKTADRQTMMFSATFPREIQMLASEFLRQDYLFLSVGRVGAASENVTQEVVYVEEHDKTAKLLEILRSLPFPPSLVLVFVGMKRTADVLEKQLRDSNINATALHGDLKQWEREMGLRNFKDGTAPVLVATDVAARGLDIPHVSHVINYDMSNAIDDYVHRIGRTGRAGHTGKAITFFNRTNGALARDLEKLLRENKQAVPEWLGPLAYARREYPSRGRDDYGGGGRRGGRGGRGGRDGGRRGGGRDDFIDDIDLESLDPSTMDYRQWDRLMKARRAKEAAAAPAKKVYASVAVVSDDKAPDWLADDDDGMAWGDDRLPTNIRGI